MQDVPAILGAHINMPSRALTGELDGLQDVSSLARGGSQGFSFFFFPSCLVFVLRSDFLLCGCGCTRVCCPAATGGGARVFFS
jgi:hypothetical protein